MTIDELEKLKETARLVSMYVPYVPYSPGLPKYEEIERAREVLVKAAPRLIEECLVQGKRVAEMWLSGDNTAVVENLRQQLAAAHKRADQEANRANRNFRAGAELEEELRVAQVELADAHARNKRLRAQVGDLYLKLTEIREREATVAALIAKDISKNIDAKMREFFGVAADA